MTLISRSDWGARLASCSGGTRDLASIAVAHVHYADAAAPRPDTADEAAMVRAIQDFHMDTRGWCDIGYHRLIGPDGSVFEGRPLEEIGAETAGHNADSAGYCFLTDGEVTDTAWSAFLAQLTVDKQAIGHSLEVRPHSADVATNCPGDPLRARIDALATPTPAPTPGGTDVPNPTDLTAVLDHRDGLPAGRVIHLHGDGGVFAYGYAEGETLPTYTVWRNDGDPYTFPYTDPKQEGKSIWAYPGLTDEDKNLPGAWFQVIKLGPPE